MRKNKTEKKISKSKNIKSDSGGTLKAICSGLLSFILVLAVLSVILTLLIMYTDISDTTVHVLYITILLIAALIGGFKTGRKCSQKGLIHGFAVGIILCIIALIYTGAAADIAIYDAVIKSLIVMIATSVGGIIGVK